jgi:hypothetical protein
MSSTSRGQLTGGPSANWVRFVKPGRRWLLLLCVYHLHRGDSCILHPGNVSIDDGLLPNEPTPDDHLSASPGGDLRSRPIREGRTPNRQQGESAFLEAPIVCLTST